MKWMTRFLFTMFCLSAGVAGAAESNLYFGAKAGLMMPDGGGLDDAVNIGVDVGIPLTELKPGPSGGLSGSLAFEGEFTITLIDGDVNYFGQSADWSVWTLGGYAAYRSPVFANNAYFKGKLGLVHSDVDIDFAGFPAGASGTDTDIAVGFGIGFKLDRRSNVEIEFTMLSDMDFLSVTYHF